MEKNSNETTITYGDKTYRLICEKVNNILIYKVILLIS